MSILTIVPLVSAIYHISALCLSWNSSKGLPLSALLVPILPHLVLFGFRYFAKSPISRAIGLPFAVSWGLSHVFQCPPIRDLLSGDPFPPQGHLPPVYETVTSAILLLLTVICVTVTSILPSTLKASGTKTFHATISLTLALAPLAFVIVALNRRPDGATGVLLNGLADRPSFIATVLTAIVCTVVTCVQVVVTGVKEARRME